MWGPLVSIFLTTTPSPSPLISNFLPHFSSPSSLPPLSVPHRRRPPQAWPPLLECGRGSRGGALPNTTGAVAGRNASTPASGTAARRAPAGFLGRGLGGRISDGRLRRGLGGRGRISGVCLRRGHDRISAGFLKCRRGTASAGLLRRAQADLCYPPRAGHRAATDRRRRRCPQVRGSSGRWLHRRMRAPAGSPYR
jgi:hypothetical protein